MKTAKVYTEITQIELIDSNTVYSVTQEKLHSDFIKDLQEHYKSDIKEICEDGSYSATLTKKQCLELSDDVRVTGYGKHSNKKLWQLPIRLKNQISKMIKPVLIEY